MMPDTEILIITANTTRGSAREQLRIQDHADKSRNTVIVHGNCGCGKTTHAREIAEIYGCQVVIDDWQQGDLIFRGAVHLTNCLPIDVAIHVLIIAFGDLGFPEPEAAAPTARQMPAGEYAIVEIMGHRTFVGRVSEVERFGSKLMSIEPIFRRQLLPPVMLGGGSIYQFTPCSAETAAERAATDLWQLPSSVRAVMPPEMLPAPDQEYPFNAND